MNWFWKVFIGFIGLIILIFFLIAMGWLGFMPSFEELENPKTNLATEVYSSDGEILGKYYIENRSNVSFSELSPHLVNTLIATEDVRFYKHSGIDIRALLRVVKGVLTFSKEGGGSTITQQLAKNLFPRDPDAGKVKLAFTKLKEWVVAVKLERNYSKHEILAMYLNTVDFGNNSFGIKSAATTYFNKRPAELNIEESAVLVGLLKAPTRFNPKRNPDNALKRRSVVLSQLENYNFISKHEYDSLKNLPIDMSNFRYQTHNYGLATYFREYLRLYLNEWCRNHKKPDGTPYDIYKDGLKIYTTIDSRMQKYAEQAVKEYVEGVLQPKFFEHWKGYKNAPFDKITPEMSERIMTTAMKQTERYKDLVAGGVSEAQIREIFNTKVAMQVFTYQGLKDTVMSPMDSIRYMKSFLQCGLMAMETNSGYVRAYVGGTNYRLNQYDHVKTSRRQVGSTFKPYIYAAAMQNGEFLPCTQIPNVPVTIESEVGGEPWTPKNSSKYKDGEMVNLKEALANSINYVSAYLMKRISPGSVVSMLEKMGVPKGLIYPVPAICLGACEMSLYEQVGAMNTFPNQGVYVEPIMITKICNNKGALIEQFMPKHNDAIDAQTAYKTVRLMQGVIEYGTGFRLRGRYEFKHPVAGKTGTTDNNSDGWFVGYTPLITCGVWVGCDDRSAHFRTTDLGQGANTALPVFALFMTKCYNDSKLGLKPGDFQPPKNMDNIEFDCSKYKPDKPVNKFD